MKRYIGLFIMFPILLALSCNQDSVSDPLPANTEAGLKSVAAKTTVKSTVDVVNPILAVVTGKSTLHRTKNGITMNYSTSGLTPGYTYTVWWVIWNNPEECVVPGACGEDDFAYAAVVEVEVLHAAGHVAGNNGKGNFSGHLKVGDASGSINDLFGLPPAGGLQAGKTFSAEVHLVLRSHGPKIPGMVNEQISSYEGGCTDPFAFPPFSEIPDAVGECGDIEFAIHPPAG